MILLAPEKSLFFIEKNKQLTISYSGKIYTLKVSGINTINSNVFVTFYTIPPKVKLIPNTTIDGVLIYDKVRLIDSLIAFN
ncbi:MAG1140 family protein [Mycoplasma sp. CSL7475-4]|uniref:MAG1140 family protein n=1 Tax=Mycoplasma sp. CSL7475-4 TaxID=2973942 RepID=UPI0037C53080